MTQPTKREQLAAMRLEEFKEHLRTIAGGSPEQISGTPRANPLLGAQSRKGSASPKAKEALSECFLLINSATLPTS